MMMVMMLFFLFHFGVVMANNRARVAVKNESLPSYPVCNKNIALIIGAF